MERKVVSRCENIISIWKIKETIKKNTHVYNRLDLNNKTSPMTIAVHHILNFLHSFICSSSDCSFFFICFGFLYVHVQRKGFICFNQTCIVFFTYKSELYHLISSMYCQQHHHCQMILSIRKRGITSSPVQSHLFPCLHISHQRSRMSSMNYSSLPS